MNKGLLKVPYIFTSLYILSKLIQISYTFSNLNTHRLKTTGGECHPQNKAISFLNIDRNENSMYASDLTRRVTITFISYLL